MADDLVDWEGDQVPVVVYEALKAPWRAQKMGLDAKKILDIKTKSLNFIPESFKSYV